MILCILRFKFARHLFWEFVSAPRLRYPTFQRTFGPGFEEARGAGPTLEGRLTPSPDPTGGPSQPEVRPRFKALREDGPGSARN
jgi:hypothetical protein